MEFCESADEPNISYVVELTGLLNEGAVSDEGGTYKNGDSRWRFKHERTVCVVDCKEAREALAFVCALGLQNSIAIKEWPAKVSSYRRWKESLKSMDEELAGYEVDNLIYVSPKEIKSSKLVMAAKLSKFSKRR